MRTVSIYFHIDSHNDRTLCKFLEKMTIVRVLSNGLSVRDMYDVHLFLVLVNVYGVSHCIIRLELKIDTKHSLIKNSIVD